MTKLYGMLAYACGSIAIATLALGIMVGGGQQAWATTGEIEEGGDTEYVGLGCKRDGATSACIQGGCISILNSCHLTVNPSLRCCY